jgi:hypothetical protein
MLFLGVPLAAMPRNDGPNAIAKNEPNDHANHKLHFLCPVRPKERAGRLDPRSRRRMRSGRTRVNGVCVSRTTKRHVRREGSGGVKRFALGLKGATAMVSETVVPATDFDRGGVQVGSH